MNTPHLRLALCLVLALALLSPGCNKLPSISKPPSAEGKWVMIPFEIELQPGGKGTFAAMGTMFDITWTQTGSTVTLIVSSKDGGEPATTSGEITPDGQKIILANKDAEGNTSYWQRVR